MATHQTAKAHNSSPANGGDWHVIEPLSKKQVINNNRKKVVTVKRESTNYVPVMG